MSYEEREKIVLEGEFRLEHTIKFVILFMQLYFSQKKVKTILRSFLKTGYRWHIIVVCPFIFTNQQEFVLWPNHISLDQEAQE